jgi:hypothetical protein
MRNRALLQSSQKVMLRDRERERERNYGITTSIIFQVLHLLLRVVVLMMKNFKMESIRNYRIVILVGILLIWMTSLSSDKACGLDEVVTQILKLNEIHCLLLDMLNNVYLSKRPSAEWLTSIFIPVHKNGSVSDTNNYRVLALMSVLLPSYIIAYSF